MTQEKAFDRVAELLANGGQVKVLRLPRNEVISDSWNKRGLFQPVHSGHDNDDYAYDIIAYFENWTKVRIETLYPKACLRRIRAKKCLLELDGR